MQRKMRRKIIGTFILLGGIFSLQAQNLVVVGKVKNIKEGTVFSLEETTGTGSSRYFSRNADENNGKVIDGQFVLNHQCRKADNRHFALYSNSTGFHRMVRLEFWANQGDTVYIEGEGPLLGTWKVRTNAHEQKELDAIHQASIKELAAYQQSLIDHEAYRQYRRDTEMSEAEWNQTTLVLAQKDTLRTTTRIAWHKKQLEAMKLLPVTDFWMYQLGTILHFASLNKDEFAPLIKELYIQNADKINRKPDGKAIREWVFPYPKAELGKVYTGGELFDAKGQKYRLEDFRGKYVLLDFWAQYCGECIANFPQLKKLQEQYADKLIVIGINVDKVSTWKTSPRQKEITWYSLSDGGGEDGGIAGSFDIKILPTYILLAPDGTYQACLKSSAMYNGTLEKYLNGEYPFRS